MLRELDLGQVYDSSTSSLVGDLIVPLLGQSRDYLRGVGYFSSGWLREAADGIVALVQNGGRGRIVTSPILGSGDWEAMIRGSRAQAEDVLRRSLEDSIEDLRSSLETNTLNCLAWLISDGLLEMKLAVPRRGWDGGDYHDKVWVFTDDSGDRVALHGSFNDSVKGTLNGEGISVFKSWIEGQRGYVMAHQQRLEALWAGTNDQFETKTLPQAAREKIVKLRTTPERPYGLPKGHPLLAAGRTGPRVDIDLWSYQEQAILSWVEAGCQGILEMATGTGKTFTSLAAAVKTYEDLGRLACVVLVPYLHLVEQWETHCRRFGFEPLLCSGEHENWRLRLASAIRDFRLGITDNLCVIAVHKTATTGSFTGLVNQIPAEELLVIGDEVHELGAPHMRSAMLPGSAMHLGLSATPRRWMDPEGTAAIQGVFGPPCFSFELDDAIRLGFLTEYDYEPVVIHLTVDEQAQYNDLSSRIAQIAAQLKDGKGKASISDQLEALLRKRAALVWAAENKLPALCARLSDMLALARSKGERPAHILVYCAPGEHKDVLRAVSGLGFKAHEFVHTVSMADRARVLDDFAQGLLEVLVAVRCLDQGVDVPATATAFLMASTTNPRQFIQRRGRVLRRAEGKSHADIFDFLVFPPVDFAECTLDIGRGMLKREMPRFAEFSLSARNAFLARKVVWDTLEAYDSLPTLDQRPWDVYAGLLDEAGLETASLDPLLTGEDRDNSS